MASKRHKLVGEFLDTIPFTKHMQKEEEVSVKTLVPNFPGFSKKIDWFVKELNLCIEVHGRQHYEPVAFGNRGDAKQQFGKQVRHDIDKQDALMDAGFLYLEIPYWVKLDEDWLLHAISGLEHRPRTEEEQKVSPSAEPVQATLPRNKWPSRPVNSASRIQSRPFQKRPQKESEVPDWKQQLAQLRNNTTDEEDQEPSSSNEPQ